MFRHFRLIALLCAVVICLEAAATHRLVLLHTNDTHSHIDADSGGRGAILDRAALIDSVRQAEPHVILIDAGDIVQGSLYFKFFGGEVEYPLMEMLGYDYMILGNHEFDNGMQDLADRYRNLKATKLSANYDFSNTPLANMFADFDIREIDGKRIGFFGINIDPASLIAEDNYRGMLYRPVVDEANRVASTLKHDLGCDLVVCISHIGYKTRQEVDDIRLANQSEDIDIIIGAHSHTPVDPHNPNQYLIPNRHGRNVLVTQTGKNGYNIGYISIDLDRIGDANTYQYRWLPVTNRFAPTTHMQEIADFISPYRVVIDSINNTVVGYNSVDMPHKSVEIANFTADFGRDYAQSVVDSLRQAGNTDLPPQIDMAIMNRGGIRQPLPAGSITQGQILNAYPFSNHIVLLQIKGSDLADAMQACASKGGEAISGNVQVTIDADRKVLQTLIDNQPIDPERIYTIATIDYLAWGNDYLDPLRNGTILWRDPDEMSVPLLQYITKLWQQGTAISTDFSPRFITK